MKIQVSQLNPIQINWLAAKADGYDEAWLLRQLGNPNPATTAVPQYLNDWSLTGSLIEREGITVGPSDTSPFKAHYGPADSARGPWRDRFVGATPMTAILRCFIAQKLGPEVEVPDELCVEKALSDNVQDRPRG
jgi:Protein of unknown function (DUF2591)